MSTSSSTPSPHAIARALHALIPLLLLAMAAAPAMAMQVSGRGVSVGGSGNAPGAVGGNGSSTPGSRQWLFSLGQDGQRGCAVFTVPGLKVAYPGESMGGTSSGAITLGGGAGQAKVGSLEITTAAGTTTVTFRGRSFSVSGLGTAVEVGRQRWAIDEARPLTLVLKADGTATVDGQGARRGKP